MNIACDVYGAPAIAINVTDEQLTDRLIDSIQYYQTFHLDAIIDSAYIHKVSQIDLDNGYIITPPDIVSISSMITTSIRGYGSLSTTQTLLNDFIYNMTTISGVTDYFIARTHLNTLMEWIKSSPKLEFSRLQNRLYFTDPQYLEVDSHVVYACQKVIDPEIFTMMLNDIWLKNYCTAVIKLQWGMNMRKYSNVSLIGGVTLNAETIIEEAKTDIQSLKDELNTTWSTPLGVYVY